MTVVKVSVDIVYLFLTFNQLTGLYGLADTVTQGVISR